MYNKYEEIEKECVVCRKPVIVDQYGQGPCEACGWYQNNLGIEHADEVIFPNLVSLNKARQLVKQGLPIAPSLEDFIDGLFFYSEMEFEFNGEGFTVCLRSSRELADCMIENDSYPEFLKEDEIFNEYVRIDETIIVFDGENGLFQYYKTREEFASKANINGVLLKDLWNEVKNPKYM